MLQILYDPSLFIWPELKKRLMHICKIQVLPKPGMHLPEQSWAWNNLVWVWTFFHNWVLDLISTLGVPLFTSSTGVSPSPIPSPVHCNPERGLSNQNQNQNKTWLIECSVVPRGSLDENRIKFIWHCLTLCFQVWAVCVSYPRSYLHTEYFKFFNIIFNLNFKIRIFEKYLYIILKYK